MASNEDESNPAMEDSPNSFVSAFNGSVEEAIRNLNHFEAPRGALDPKRSLFVSGQQADARQHKEKQEHCSYCKGNQQLTNENNQAQTSDLGAIRSVKEGHEKSSMW